MFSIKRASKRRHFKESLTQKLGTHKTITVNESLDMERELLKQFILQCMVRWCALWEVINKQRTIDDEKQRCSFFALIIR